MGRPGMRSPRASWALLAVGLLSTGCAGAIGAAAAVGFIGVGVATFTCYDRVSVTVTDRATGAKLCDAKVRFQKGGSETVATSCYQAALSAGSYTLRVERPGLVPFEEPVEVSKSGECGQTVQTMYVALDRPDRITQPGMIAPPTVSLPPVNGTVPRATGAAATSSAVPPAAVPPAAAPAPSATAPSATPPAAVPPAAVPPAAPAPPTLPAAPPPSPPPAAAAPPKATPPAAPPKATPPAAPPKAAPPAAPPKATPPAAAFPNAP